MTPWPIEQYARPTVIEGLVVSLGYSLALIVVIGVLTYAISKFLEVAAKEVWTKAKD